MLTSQTLTSWCMCVYLLQNFIIIYGPDSFNNFFTSNPLVLNVCKSIVKMLWLGDCLPNVSLCHHLKGSVMHNAIHWPWSGLYGRPEISTLGCCGCWEGCKSECFSCLILNGADISDTNFLNPARKTFTVKGGNTLVIL